MNKKLALVLSLGVFAACGGDDDGGSDIETMSNPAQATATVTQMNSFSTAFASANGPSAATAAYSMGTSASSIVVPSSDQGSARVTGPAFASPEGCVCTESGCTFTECGDEAGTWTINGSISKSGDTYSFDYTMDFNTAGYQWSWATEGELTISPTLIDGSLSGDGDGTFDDGQGNTYESSWGWDVTANDIGLDETGCAVSGSMDASVDYSGTVNGQSYSYSGDASVSFGPACGQAQ